jgi:hypothetical protein
MQWGNFVPLDRSTAGGEDDVKTAAGEAEPVS